MARGKRQRQVDLAQDLIERAKGHAEEQNHSAIRRAVHEELPAVVELMTQAGWTEIPTRNRRLVSIDQETWDALEGHAALSQKHPDRDHVRPGMIAASQIELLRACLVRAGRRREAEHGPDS